MDPNVTAPPPHSEAIVYVEHAPSLGPLLELFQPFNPMAVRQFEHNKALISLPTAQAQRAMSMTPPTWRGQQLKIQRARTRPPIMHPTWSSPSYCNAPLSLEHLASQFQHSLEQIELLSSQFDHLAPAFYTMQEKMDPQQQSMKKLEQAVLTLQGKMELQHQAILQSQQSQSQMMNELTNLTSRLAHLATTVDTLQARLGTRWTPVPPTPSSLPPPGPMPMQSLPPVPMQSQNPLPTPLQSQSPMHNQNLFHIPVPMTMQNQIPSTIPVPMPMQNQQPSHLPALWPEQNQMAPLQHTCQCQCHRPTHPTQHIPLQPHCSNPAPCSLSSLHAQQHAGICPPRAMASSRPDHSHCT